MRLVHGVAMQAEMLPASVRNNYQVTCPVQVKPAAAPISDVARQVTQALERIRNKVFHARIVTEQLGNKLPINTVLLELQTRVKAGQLLDGGTKNGIRLFERVRTAQKPARVAKPTANPVVVVAAAAAAAAASPAAAPKPNPVSFMGFDDDTTQETEEQQKANAFDPEADFM